MIHAFLPALRVRLATTAIATAAILLAGFAAADPPVEAPKSAEPSKPAEVKKIELGDIPNLHRCGAFLIAGQPTPADLALLKGRGVECIVTFRTPGEVQWDEAAAAEKAGLEWIQIPYGTIDSLTDSVFASARKVFQENGDKPLFLHCGAGPRVITVWLPYRVLDEQVPLDKALEEAEEMGLRSKALRQRAVEYIESQQPS